MNNNKITTEITEEINKVIENTYRIIEEMNAGDRIQMKELAREVGIAVNMEPKDVLPFVNHLVHNIPSIAYVARGKNGGVIKGTKPMTPGTTTIKAAPAKANGNNINVSKPVDEDSFDFDDE